MIITIITRQEWFVLKCKFRAHLEVVKWGHEGRDGGGGGQVGKLIAKKEGSFKEEGSFLAQD